MMHRLPGMHPNVARCSSIAQSAADLNLTGEHTRYEPNCERSLSAMPCATIFEMTARGIAVLDAA
jgi:hypothetical protein